MPATFPFSPERVYHVYPDSPVGTQSMSSEVSLIMKNEMQSSIHPQQDAF
ncbi:rCG46812 [Rattus norvegicus]|uniref:RCG46812 n=1 Tax=Rattus norvegicus TaxID=10116 RepID=A6IX42_RAT|nr:rCG46812 [Rattus norvegicus]